MVGVLAYSAAVDCRTLVTVLVAEIYMYVIVPLSRFVNICARSL